MIDNVRQAAHMKSAKGSKEGQGSLQQCEQEESIHLLRENL